MVATVLEIVDPGDVPLYRHPGWRDRFPSLVQGTTGRGGGEDEFDLGAFGVAPIGEVVERWKVVRDALAMHSVVHARQVHGSRLGLWDDPVPPGLCLTEGFDAHLTPLAGLLLAVSIADCVPVFVVAEESPTVALVHAGWRGVAAGAFEETVRALSARALSPARLWVHFGPAICGRCYEVGPEVHARVHPDRTPPAEATPIDLRAALAGRARRLGVPEERISISAHCTRCGPGDFFSHRGGDAGRQMGVLGRRA